jgi:cytochrome P450
MQAQKISDRQTKKYVEPDLTLPIVRDPLPSLLELAKRGPVISGRNHVFDGIAIPNYHLMPDQEKGVFLALSFDAVQKILSDPKNFSSAQAMVNSTSKAWGKALPAMDAPEHGIYRSLVAPAFAHRAVTTDLVHIARAIIEDCFAPLKSRGHADLVSEFAVNFPYLVVAKVFGLPAEDKEAHAQSLLARMSISYDEGGALSTKREMNDLFLPVIAAHRAKPHDDLIGALINSEINGQKLSDDEITSFLRTIIGAGLDTTARGTCNILYHLLSSPEQMKLLKEHPSLLEQAALEGMRVATPGGLVARRAVNDVEVCGVMIPAGHYVHCSIRAANCDESRWPNPTKFDIQRPRKPTLTFGAGPHICIGLALAMTEIKIALEMVLNLPNLRPDPELWGATEMLGFFLRSPNQLPVLWDV